MEIKGLTLHQPWASLVAAGAKRIETRSWKTKWRGLLAIHASQHCPDSSVWRDPAFNVALNEALPNERLLMPIGVIVAVAELTNIFSTVGTVNGRPFTADWLNALIDNERVFGDYSAGRYAWFLRRVVRLPEPIPYRGAERLWAIDQETSERLVTAWANAHRENAA